MEKIKGPFLRSRDNTSKIMARLLISLIPIILFAVYKNGYIPYSKGYINIYGIFYPLIFILIGMITSYLTEIIFYIFKGLRGNDLINKILSSYGIFPGLFLSLVLPINTPIIILILGTIFGAVIGKLVYGGFGNNIFNPALIGYLFIMTCYGSVLSSAYLNLFEKANLITSATPLTNLALTSGIGTFKTLVAPFGNLYNFLFGMIPGALGETCKILIILSFAYLTSRKVIKYRISITYVFTVFIITTVIGLINNTGMWYPLFQILSGGLLFGAVFMATDPVTSPITKKGQILYGVMLGILTVVFRYLTNAPEGVMLSILTMNMLVFIIDKIGSSFKTKYYVIALSSLIVLGLLLTYGISVKYKDNGGNTNIDNNYRIVSKKKDNDKFIYTVLEKGNGGDIKATITFNNDKVISIDILENNETPAYYKKVIDSNYIDTLINNQDKLNELDSVSGATISSTALKKMVINTIDDYKKNGIEEVENRVEDTSVIIDNKEVSGNQIIYNVSTNTFGGDMLLHITVIDKLITKIDVISYMDTCYSTIHTNDYYKCPTYVEDSNYINDLIANQNNIDDVDTISGATFTSKGIKKAIIKVIGDINEK